MNGDLTPCAPVPELFGAPRTVLRATDRSELFEQWRTAWSPRTSRRRSEWVADCSKPCRTVSNSRPRTGCSSPGGVRRTPGANSQGRPVLQTRSRERKEDAALRVATPTARVSAGTYTGGSDD